MKLNVGEGAEDLFHGEQSRQLMLTYAHEDRELPIHIMLLRTE
ncbi:MAG: hypothetical protein AAFQ82_03735 [Myxococcota bacterium]